MTLNFGPHIVSFDMDEGTNTIVFLLFELLVTTVRLSAHGSRRSLRDLRFT
jgi:hypothetical protein